MKNTNVEVEGGELLLMSDEGHYAIIPAKHRQEVKDMVSEGCNSCINSYIQTLPKESNYAEDGSLFIDGGDPKTIRQDNTRVNKTIPIVDNNFILKSQLIPKSPELRPDTRTDMQKKIAEDYTNRVNNPSISRQIGETFGKIGRWLGSPLKAVGDITGAKNLPNTEQDIYEHRKKMMNPYTSDKEKLKESFTEALKIGNEDLLMTLPLHTIGANAAKIASKLPQKVGKVLSKTTNFLEKPNPNSYYRLIGDEEGYNDLLTSGFVRPNQKGIFKDRNTYYTKGAINDINNPVIGNGVKKGTFYKGKYLVEVNPNNVNFPTDKHNLNPEWNFGLTSKGKEIPYTSEYLNVYKYNDEFKKYELLSKDIPKSVKPSIKNLFKSKDLSKDKVKSGLDWMKEWSSDPKFVERYEKINKDKFYNPELFQEHVLETLDKYKPKNYLDLLKDKGFKKYFKSSLESSGLSYGNPKGIYLNRSAHLFDKKGLESTRTHELTHLTEYNGALLSNKDKKVLLKEFHKTIPEEEKNKLSGWQKFMLDDRPEYYLDPTEIHARMNEARYTLNLGPKDEFTLEMFDKIKKKNDWFGMGIYIKDKKSFVNLMNKFWSVTAAVPAGIEITKNKNK